jgi:hypothetical protein
MPDDGYGSSSYMLIVDKYSGAAYAVPMGGKTSQDAGRAFSEGTHWVIDTETVRVDADSVLNSDEFIELMKRSGIQVEMAYKGHQQVNFAERVVQELKTMLTLSLDGLPKGGWRRILPSVIEQWNLSYSASRGASPFEILTGHQPRGITPYNYWCDERTLGHLFNSREELWDIVAKNMEKAAKQNEVQYNKRHTDARFVVGEFVLVRNKSEEKGDGRFNLSAEYNRDLFEVIGATSEVSYILQSCEKPSITRAEHVSQLKRVGPAVDSRIQEDGSFDGGSPEEPVGVIHRLHKRRRVRGGVEFLVEWAGSSATTQWTWEDRDDLLLSAGEFVRRFEAVLG